MDGSKIESAMRSQMPTQQKSEAERISDLEHRVVMLENAARMHSQNSERERVARIERFLQQKLGMLPEPATPIQPAPQSNA